MQFARETLTAKLLEEIAPLLAEHWKEIAHFHDIPLSPNLEQYKKLEEAGAIRLFTARDEEAQLAGYNLFFLTQSLHYSTSLQAQQDILFLLPKYRKAMWGSRFIRWCDEELRKDGVQLVTQHMKAKHSFGPILERQGYELVDLIYAKRLDGEAHRG